MIFGFGKLGIVWISVFRLLLVLVFIMSGGLMFYVVLDVLVCVLC